MEKQTITIGKIVRFTQGDDGYIVEECNVIPLPKGKQEVWEEIARFKLGFDAITFLKNYLDEVIKQMKQPLPSIVDQNKLG